MRAQTFHDADADQQVLTGRTVAVIGFGNQGSAQSQNLRDSGVPVLVGNREDTYRQKAIAAGFEVVDIADAARDGDVVLLLIPDEVQPQVVAEQVVPGLRAGNTLVVASGYNAAFGLLPLPEDIDLVMVAPRMIGAAVRQRYLDGIGYPCFVSVEQDASGGAVHTALAVAHGIGGTKGGAVISSAREEAALDLFSEQAIWPAVFGIFQAAYEVLADAGFSDDAILDEMYLSGEPAEVLARAADVGLLEQLQVHSRTSQYGQLSNLKGETGLIDTMRDRFAQVLHDRILSGEFAQDWSTGDDDGEERLRTLYADANTHPLLVAERTVLESLPSSSPPSRNTTS